MTIIPAAGAWPVTPPAYHHPVGECVLPPQPARPRGPAPAGRGAAARARIIGGGPHCARVCVPEPNRLEGNRT